MRIAHEVDSAEIAKNAKTNEIRIFAETLNDLIYQQGIHQDAMAHDIGISVGVLSKYRRGISEPGFANLLKMANYLGVDCHYLMTGISSKHLTIHEETGLSEKAISALRTINEIPLLQENAKPGLDRLLSSSGLAKLLLRLTAAFEFQDEAPTEELILRAYHASKNQDFAEYERVRFELIHDDLSDRVSNRDLFEYRAQKALLSIIRESESEVV